MRSIYMDNIERIINLFSKADLRANLDGASYFIMIYEAFTDMLEYYVKSFFENYSIEDGELITKLSPKYEELFLKNNFKLKNGQVRTGSLYARLDWFKSMGAIDDNEIQLVDAARLRRNTIVHEFFNTLQDGLGEEDARLMSGLLLLYMKIDNWYFKNVEAELVWDEIPEDSDLDASYSLNTMFLRAIYQILFMDKGDEYDKALRDLLGQIRS